MEAGDFHQLKEYLKENLAIWVNIKPYGLAISLELERVEISEDVLQKSELQPWLDET